MSAKKMPPPQVIQLGGYEDGLPKSSILVLDAHCVLSPHKAKSPSQGQALGELSESIHRHQSPHFLKIASPVGS
jgi:hypothetical protein